jgi:hypothetical protein
MYLVLICPCPHIHLCLHCLIHPSPPATICPYPCPPCLSMSAHTCSFALVSFVDMPLSLVHPSTCPHSSVPVPASFIHVPHLCMPVPIHLCLCCPHLCTCHPNSCSHLFMCPAVVSYIPMTVCSCFCQPCSCTCHPPLCTCYLHLFACCCCYMPETVLVLCSFAFVQAHTCSFMLVLPFFVHKPLLFMLVLCLSHAHSCLCCAHAALVCAYTPAPLLLSVLPVPHSQYIQI